MSILEQVDLHPALAPGDFAEQLAHYQAALSELDRPVFAQRRPVVIVFEGWEAAGRGDAIKRLTEKLDPNSYVVYPDAPPEGDDSTHHYLYRFWRRLPERGHIAIFDGSWYGRVLAGRVEGLCTEAEWRRAYRELDQFERQLTDFGTIVVKFWLHIGLDEQLRRLRDAQTSGLAEPSLAVQEGRTRSKRALYEAAVEEMLLKTSTLLAPWTIVEANDDLWAQIKVLRAVDDTLVRALDYAPEGWSGDLEEKVGSKPPAPPVKDEHKKGKAKAKTGQVS
jgi:AMP-polyphosphate phosphotransferase